MMIPTACHGDGDCVSCYVNKILDCYHKLSQSPDLKPSPSINCLFERLVELCGQIPNEAIASQVCHTGHTANDSTSHRSIRFCQTPKSLT